MISIACWNVCSGAERRPRVRLVRVRKWTHVHHLDGLGHGDYVLAPSVDMTDDFLQDYEVEVETNLRFAVVCRDVRGEDRDDVAIDSVEVVCQ